MTQNVWRFLMIGLLVAAFALSAVAAENPKNGAPATLPKTGAVDLGVYTVLNINNFGTWHRNDGYSNHTPSGSSGGYYPRGTSTAIYLDNFMWAGIAYTDAAKTTKAFSPTPFEAGVRVGGGTYNHGLRAGALLGSGATASPEPTSASVRNYRIRRDYYVMTDEEYKKDAADINQVPVDQVTDVMVAQIRDQYALDWAEWPVAKGAPYIERNGTAGYQAPPAFSATFGPGELISGNHDEPGVAGADPNSPADQVIWNVANDFTTSVVQGVQGSYPLGLEVQKTIWGYKGTAEIGNIYFQRIKMLNKGGAITTNAATRGEVFIDSMFVCFWSDPDVGDSGDDLAGCDSTLSLGFAYNGQGRDAEYVKFKLQPPAVGYDFLQGPIIDSPGDSAVFDLKRVYDKKNLGMSSFAYFSAGSSISDPAFTAEGGTRWWRMLRGYVPDTYTEPLRKYPHPPGYVETGFPLSGDPVTGQGFIDGLGQDYSLTSGDRRILLNTGPFSLNPGEAQEIVVGTVAGLGADRISSVAVMKYNDQAVQGIYNGLFKVPLAPAPPTVVRGELDQNVVLSWGADLTTVDKIENLLSEPGTFTFEGYRVYQLPSASALKQDGKVIFDADVVNTIGNNSGIDRKFQFAQDYLRDIPRLQNGQEYFLAVTAYARSADPDFVPKELESELRIYTVVPQGPKPGETIPSEYADAVTVTQTAGLAVTEISLNVVDPKKVTGDAYEIRVAVPDSVDVDLGGATLRVGDHQWYVYNVTKGVNATPLMKEYTISTANIIFDGLQLGLAGSPYYVPYAEIASVSAPSNWRGVNWGGTVLGGGIDCAVEFFGSSLERYQVKTDIEIRFNAAQTQKAYVYERLVNSTGSGTAQFRGLFDQPFTVWDVTNPASPRQVDFFFIEMNDLTTNSTNTSFRGSNKWDIGVQNDREYFFISNNTYSETDQYGQTVGTSTATPIFSTPLLYAGWLRLNDTTVAPYVDGDVLKIIAAGAHFVEPGNVWSFNTADVASKVSVDAAKKDIDKINVYPNPYYAFNPAEVNRFNRYVKFNGLPQEATVRIFNLAGQMVRTLVKNDDTQFLRWDLTNTNNFPVASGMYIAYIDMPSLGTKILKLAIIQEQEVLDVY